MDARTENFTSLDQRDGGRAGQMEVMSTTVPGSNHASCAPRYRPLLGAEGGPSNRNGPHPLPTSRRVRDAETPYPGGVRSTLLFSPTTTHYTLPSERSAPGGSLTNTYPYRHIGGTHH
jgi:hypothetical protein